MQKTAFKDFYVEMLIYRLNECEKLLEEATDIKSKQKVLWHNTYLSSKLDIYSPEYNERLRQEIKKLEAKTKEIESHQ